jgi:hypothetical protein
VYDATRTTKVRVCLNWCAHPFGARPFAVASFFDTKNGDIALENKGMPGQVRGGTHPAKATIQHKRTQFAL